MALNDAALDLMAGALAGSALYLSLHSAAPSASGSNETSAARLAAGWSSASGGAISISAARAFTGGASNGAVTHVGLWSAATTGTFYGSFPVTGDASFNSAGEYTLDSLTVSGA